jgi:hypothetical protein
MVRKGFLVLLALVLTSEIAPAQIREIESALSGSVQQPPVYLKKSLTSARDKERESAEDIDDDDVLVEETINRLGRAFDAGNAQTLESCLVTGKRKIYLALEIDEPQPGHYGPGQVRHIFGRLFRGLETRSFVYDSREITRQSGAAVFRADWTYVVLDTDELVTERLQFKLDANDWRVFEIRAASR